VDSLQGGVASGAIHSDDVTHAVLQDCLHTRGSPPVSLLIRTSGETRLSDFLLWQTGRALLCFVDVLWPDFSYMQFVKCVLRWQQSAADLEAISVGMDAAAGCRHSPAVQTSAPPPACPAACRTGGCGHTSQQPPGQRSSHCAACEGHGQGAEQACCGAACEPCSQRSAAQDSKHASSKPGHRRHHPRVQAFLNAQLSTFGDWLKTACEYR
jgi:hypothetical protein